MKTIEINTLKKVESSNLEFIGFHVDKTFIKFKNGKLYEYPNTTGDEFDRLANADSVGKEFFKSFKSKQEFILLEDIQLKQITKKDEYSDEPQLPCSLIKEDHIFINRWIGELLEDKTILSQSFDEWMTCGDSYNMAELACMESAWSVRFVAILVRKKLEETQLGVKNED